MSRKLMLILGILMVASMVMSACQPQTIVETKEVPVEVTKEVVVTQQSTVIVQQKAFTTPHPILGDLKVRQAIAYCTNKLDLIKSVYPLVDEASQQKLIMNTFIPSYQWAYAGDANITIYPFDKDKGAKSDRSHVVL